MLRRPAGGAAARVGCGARGSHLHDGALYTSHVLLPGGTGTDPEGGKAGPRQPYAGSFQDEIARHQAVHHLVVVPNFNEPEDILSRTLQSLAVQAGARQNMTVVLGMEAREPEARDKAEALLARYKGSFYGMLATFHPSDLPGEAPGKGTNETWAVRRAREELVERLGIPPEQIVVTVIDSDSILHPCYFAELTRQFAADPRPPFPGLAGPHSPG